MVPIKPKQAKHVKVNAPPVILAREDLNVRHVIVHVHLEPTALLVRANVLLVKQGKRQHKRQHKE